MRARILFNNNNYDCNVSDEASKSLNSQVLDLLVKKTNRSIGQTKFLFNILGDLKLLIELEESIKVFHCYYCPGDYAECMYLIGKLRTWKSCGWVKSNFNLI